MCLPINVAVSDRAAVARAALAAAEARTGARRVALVGRGRPDDVVARRAAEGVGSLAEPTVSLLTTERPPLPAPPALGALLPDGLRRGAVTVVQGSTWLLLGLLAHACADGAWGAVVGHPDLGLLAAGRAGVPLDRLGLVPDPADRAAAVLAALVDGVGVILVGPAVRLSDADRRRLTSRVRDRGAALLAADWPGAHVVLRATPARWTGLGRGDGRLRAGKVRVTRDGRPDRVDLTLPLPAPADVPVAPGPRRTPVPLGRVG